VHFVPTFRVEDRGKNFVRNVGDFLPVHTMSHLGRRHCSDIAFCSTHEVVMLAIAGSGTGKESGQVLWDLGELELRGNFHAASAAMLKQLPDSGSVRVSFRHYLTYF
jgi:hypothetical protein